MRIAILTAAAAAVLALASGARAQSAPPAPEQAATPTRAFPLSPAAQAPPPPPDSRRPEPPPTLVWPPPRPQPWVPMDQTSWQPAPAPKPQRRWYGGEVIATDASSVGLALMGFQLDAPELLLPALGGYLFGGPIVHLAEGHPLKSLGSFGLRLSPVAVMLTAAALWPAPTESHELAGYGRGLGILTIGVVSILPVMIIDSAAIAWEDVPPAPRASFTAVPSVMVTKSSIAASLAGSF